MTQHEALQALLTIGNSQRSRERGGSDEYPSISEADHIKADQVLLDLVNNFQIRQAYYRIEKWYS